MLKGNKVRLEEKKGETALTRGGSCLGAKKAAERHA